MPKLKFPIPAVFQSLSRFRHRKQVVRQDIFIGELLKRRGLITDDQLEKALETQREILMQDGRMVRLGMVICQLGYTTEEKIVKAINDEYKINVSTLSDNIHQQVIEKHGTFFDHLPYPRIPIWFQLSVATTFIVVLTILTLSMVVLNQQKARLYEQTVRMGTVSLNYFANNARIPLLEDNVLGLNTLIREATKVEGLRYALIVDTQGVIKAHTNVDRIGRVYQPPRITGSKQKKGEVVYYAYQGISGEHLLDLGRDIKFKGKFLGQVHVGVSLDFIKQLIEKERISVILITVVVVLVGLVIAVMFGFRFSRPINQLVQATQQIARGNYRYKVPLKRKDELGNLAAAFNRMSEELWKNAMAQKSFGKYLGSEIMAMILADPEKTWLKGSRNEASVLFIDVRQFTPIAANQPPEQVVEWLNQFLEAVTAVIIEYGGYVDKFIGDAVLAVFGVPIFRKDHAQRAVRCAVALQKELGRQKHGRNPLMGSAGISIHTGDVVAGNIGSADKMEYTVIGDTVNIASRLNSLAGPGKVVISKAVKKRLPPGIEVVSLGRHNVKGKADPIEVYEIVC